MVLSKFLSEKCLLVFNDATHNIGINDTLIIKKIWITRFLLLIFITLKILNLPAASLKMGLYSISFPTYQDVS